MRTVTFMDPYATDKAKRKKEKLVPHWAIVSKIGLPIDSALPQGFNKKRIAAMTASLFSLAERSIIEVGKGDFEQLFIKGSDGYLTVTSKTTSDILLTVASDIKLQLIIEEIRRSRNEEIKRNTEVEQISSSKNVNANSKEITTYKIVLFGEASVRKTSLTIRFISGFFLEDLKLTIGVDFYSKIINYKNKKVKLQIWDFGGEERFKFLLPTYVRNADGALIVYEASDSNSLVHIDDWLMLVRKGFKLVDIPIILVGLVPESDDEREVSSEEGMKIAKSKALNGFIECNIKSGKNVEEIFLALMKIMLFKSERENQESFRKNQSKKIKK